MYTSVWAPMWGFHGDSLTQSRHNVGGLIHHSGRKFWTSEIMRLRAQCLPTVLGVSEKPHLSRLPRTGHPKTKWLLSKGRKKELWGNNDIHGSHKRGAWNKGKVHVTPKLSPFSGIEAPFLQPRDIVLVLCSWQVSVRDMMHLNGFLCSVLGLHLMVFGDHGMVHNAKSGLQHPKPSPQIPGGLKVLGVWRVSGEQITWWFYMQGWLENTIPEVPLYPGFPSPPILLGSLHAGRWGRHLG